MIEIKNRQKSPVQLIIKTRPGNDKVLRGFTTLNIPGIGSGKNIYYLEDERMTEYVERAEKVFKLISTKKIPDNKIKGRR